MKQKSPILFQVVYLQGNVIQVHLSLDISEGRWRNGLCWRTFPWVVRRRF